MCKVERNTYVWCFVTCVLFVSVFYGGPVLWKKLTEPSISVQPPQTNDKMKGFEGKINTKIEKISSFKDYEVYRSQKGAVLIPSPEFKGEAITKDPYVIMFKDNCHLQKDEQVNLWYKLSDLEKMKEKRNQGIVGTLNGWLLTENGYHSQKNEACDIMIVEK